eukprot:bmy_19124T0
MNQSTPCRDTSTVTIERKVVNSLSFREYLSFQPAAHGFLIKIVIHCAGKETYHVEIPTSENSACSVNLEKRRRITHNPATVFHTTRRKSGRGVNIQVGTPPAATEWLGRSQGGNGGGGQGGQPWQWLRQRKRPLDKTAGRGAGGNRLDQGTRPCSNPTYLAPLTRKTCFTHQCPRDSRLAHPLGSCPDNSQPPRQPPANTEDGAGVRRSRENLPGHQGLPRARNAQVTHTPRAQPPPRALPPVPGGPEEALMSPRATELSPVSRCGEVQADLSFPQSLSQQRHSGSSSQISATVNMRKAFSRLKSAI